MLQQQVHLLLQSLQPIVRQAPPALGQADRDWARNPIDHFIAAKLSEEQLTHSVEADRRTLIRRVYYDLLGLPPTPDDVREFVADPDPLAYEQLVEGSVEIEIFAKATLQGTVSIAGSDLADGDGDAGTMTPTAYNIEGGGTITALAWFDDGTD